MALVLRYTSILGTAPVALCAPTLWFSARCVESKAWCPESITYMASHTQEYSSAAVQNGTDSEREQVFNAFRRWGYLQASLDPLGQQLLPLPLPELDELSGPYADEARRIYSGTVGTEFMHILDPEKRRFIQENLEGGPAP